MPLTRRLILQKARRHPAPKGQRLRRIVGTRFQELFHSPPGVLFTIPSRYLSAIGHQGVFRLTRWSWQIHGRFQESAATREHSQSRLTIFTYGTLTLYGRPSQTLQLTISFITARPVGRPVHKVPQHRTRNPCQVSHAHGLASIRFRSPLLTESLLFSLPAGTEMFHFPAFPPHTLCIQVRVTPHDWCRVSPFGHPGINARLTAPPGLSRPPTSFIGSWCQGIHRMPSAT